MAQQQRLRDEFGNDQRAYDVRDRDRDVRKNDDESDRWRDEFGSRTAVDPVANYAYGNIGSDGYGAPPTGGPYAGTNYGASGFEYGTAYGTTGTAPGYVAPTGFGSGAPGEGQWGREANADRGGDSGRNRNRNMDMNRDRDMDTNMHKGRDQK